ncbi:His Kinase A (phospho-acceptor) domain-containing protein [Propionispira arboris]|uniref:histidine kinase n=1 Tax=Propionispira arboris TaxID=84035 RepID=A0A1H7AM36_9FIRM|nr:ATP-binding protein [Propionispira arboris]SEJ66438.1 His Kinase A (phospho-acceptor) domain-containing protein [Propionispira arboris]
MDNLHRLLKRQIKNHLDNIEFTAELQSFISAVNQAYITQDKDRSLLERSIDISSKEYNESMEKIRMLQSQLIQQEKMAGIGQLSAGIAHEINNPLGYTQSNLDTLQKYLYKIKDFLDTLNHIESTLQTEPTDNVLNILNTIRTSQKKNKINIISNDIEDIIGESITGLNRIEKIVKSLLGFARSSTSEFEDYDLNKGIIDTLAVANNEIKYVATVVEKPGDIPHIEAAGGSINQVLLNLIINAVHAIKDTSNKGIITLKTFEKNDSVYCSITDNGIGISKENLDSIFTPFFTTKPVGTGTGLGLSIAYDIIVNKHAGEIKIESEEGKGTTFILRLPIHHKSEVPI